MFDGIDWATDVLPLIQDELTGTLIAGAIAFIVAVSLVGFAARAVIGIFWKRD